MPRGRDHLVWDWNGTLLDDLHLVVSATNAVLAAVGGPVITVEEHRTQYRRPIMDYYAEVLGRMLDAEEFARLDKLFHEAYRLGLAECTLTADAAVALRSWHGSQSLLSMWFHDELVPTVDRYGLTPHFRRIDGLRAGVGGGRKASHLARHLAAVGVEGRSTVLIGDSIDDAEAAAYVGARCVLYTGGITDPARLRASGWPVADSLTEAVALAAELD
ncbi:HAD family hydrolase [Micromonospora sp. HM5-17]|jgi:phosphoglycolate phosphatase-like HAD superfamily hydrolase|uniref:HAD family hydrolase n=1 Tax=Micromonospora sp. HM5-17 TaxID=2487710 RepID=UPI000F483747|nr:HAD hydrolase-like protein [Micromonospora sp. HM5-17]ROT31974.1 HAD family hydrolase [Micromonospora sp. HM5-17]